MSIEDEIWDEFNDFSNDNGIVSIRQGLNLGYFEKIGKVTRSDKPQPIWHINNQTAVDELVDKVLLGEKKWDDVVDILPKRVVNKIPVIKTRQQLEKERMQIEKKMQIPDSIKMNKLILSVFQTQEHAIDYLKVKRFPDDINCIRCGSGTIYVCSSGQYKCPSCNYKFIETTKTIFTDTKLELTKWYGAIAILTSKRKVSTHKLAEIIGTTQKTSYYMARKIKNNINDPLLREVNRGIFQYKPNQNETL